MAGELREHTLIVNSYFVIAFAPSEKEAWDFVDKLPESFHKKGYFNVDSFFDRIRGGHAILWNCKALKDIEAVITTPYKVTHPSPRIG